MTGANDDPFPRDEAPAEAAAVAPASVLLLDIEPAMAELFDAWLSREDCACVMRLRRASPWH